MTVSSISLASSMYQNQQTYGQSNSQQIRQEFKDLGGALQSSDQSGANTAYAVLQQLLSNVLAGNQTSSGSTSGDTTTTDASVDPLTSAQTGTGQSSDAQSTFSTDFAALGQALQSGDISQAQNAFQTLQQDMQSVGHRHHHFASFYAQAALDTTAASSAGLVSDNVDSVDLSV
jgi:hypothetical protein